MSLALFGGAIMALCSGRTKGVRLSFPDLLFFGSFRLEDQ